MEVSGTATVPGHPGPSGAAAQPKTDGRSWSDKVHDGVYIAKCVIIGGLACVGGIGVLASGTGLWGGLLALGYGVWVLSGILTGGWRIFIY